MELEMLEKLREEFVSQLYCSPKNIERAIKQLNVVSNPLFSNIDNR